MHHPKITPEKALGEGKIVNMKVDNRPLTNLQFVEDLKKWTQSVSVQRIVNYDPACPSRILIKDMKKVVNSFAQCLDEMDIANATQSTCSKAEACLHKRDGTFETRPENEKGVEDKREGNKWKYQDIANLLLCVNPVVGYFGSALVSLTF